MKMPSFFILWNLKKAPGFYNSGLRWPSPTTIFTHQKRPQTYILEHQMETISNSSHNEFLLFSTFFREWFCFPWDGNHNCYNHTINLGYVKLLTFCIVMKSSSVDSSSSSGAANSKFGIQMSGGFCSNHILSPLHLHRKVLQTFFVLHFSSHMICCMCNGAVRLPVPVNLILSSYQEYKAFKPTWTF